MNVKKEKIYQFGYKIQTDKCIAVSVYDKFGIYRAGLGRRSRCVNACQCRNCRRLRLN